MRKFLLRAEESTFRVRMFVVEAENESKAEFYLDRAINTQSEDKTEGIVQIEEYISEPDDDGFYLTVEDEYGEGDEPPQPVPSSIDLALKLNPKETLPLKSNRTVLVKVAEKFAGTVWHTAWCGPQLLIAGHFAFDCPEVVGWIELTNEEYE